MTVRAIRQRDREALLESFKELKEETLYSRFFAPKKVLSESDLKQLTEVDFDRTVALVVTLSVEGQQKIIGEGRYISFKDAEDLDSAEFALIVGENYQGIGLGKLIFNHLLSIARERGISRFKAEVLPANERMLNLLRKSGLPVHMTTKGETVNVSVNLQPAAWK